MSFPPQDTPSDVPTLAPLSLGSPLADRSPSSSARGTDWMDSRNSSIYGGDSFMGGMRKVTSARDLAGYKGSPPVALWPGGAKVAVQIVLNYEEGGENCLLHGDTQSEHLLSEIIGAAPLQNERHANMESMYDYGSRAGFWRLHKMLLKYGVPVTVFAVGMALERNEDAAAAMQDAGWEIASHGYRWIDYQDVAEETERDHISRCVEIHKKLFGKPPAGIYQGKPNIHTRRLVVEQGCFLYDADSYADDLPYWTFEFGRPHLIVPYSLSENDMRFVTPSGWSHGDQFAQHLMDTLDELLEEGHEGHPKMMSVGLHCRIVGRPGRARALAKFLHYLNSKPKGDVWVATREDIARHWHAKHWPQAYD